MPGTGWGHIYSSTQSDSRQTAVKGYVCGTVVILGLLHFFLPFLNVAASLVFRHGSAEDADHLALMRATRSKHLICYKATAQVSNVLFIKFPSIFVLSNECDISEQISTGIGDYKVKFVNKADLNNNFSVK